MAVGGAWFGVPIEGHLTACYLPAEHPRSDDCSGLESCLMTKALGMAGALRKLPDDRCIGVFGFVPTAVIAGLIGSTAGNRVQESLVQSDHCLLLGHC